MLRISAAVRGAGRALLSGLALAVMVSAGASAQMPVPRPEAAATVRVPLPPRRPAYLPVRRVSEAAALTGPGRPETVCRDPRLVGSSGATVVGHYPGCLILDPVKIARVGDVRLSTPAVLDCRTARSFANWLSGVVVPEARRRLGTGVAEVWVIGSYACRSRNNLAGTRLSEHSVGRALDIGGVTLSDGRQVTVLGDWGRGAPGEFLRAVRAKACGGFTTVLGPGSDAHHRDHLHLDTAARNGSYCR